MQRLVVVVGGRGGIKETREASSEFDGVIAQTSETVTRGVSFLPQRCLPRAAPFSAAQSATSLKFSRTQSPGPNWVTVTKVSKIHM